MPRPINPQLSFKEKVAYGLGDSASNFFFQFFGLFGVYYYTDIFNLSPAFVGTMILVVRMFDAVLDPAIGILADRTETRWGKFRPFILWGAIPYAVFGYLMFLNPALGPGGREIYACATYTLVWVAYSFINIPYSALLGVISPSSTERASVSSIRFTCAFAATALIGWGTVPMKNWLGHGNDATGMRTTMLIFSVVAAVLFLVSFAGTRERVKPPAQKSDLKRDLADLARNRSWVILVVLGLVLLIAIGLRNAMNIYYFKYLVGSETGVATFNLYGFLAFIAGTTMTPLLLKYADGRTWLTILYIAVGLVWCSFYLLDPKTQFGWVMGLNILANFIAGPQPALLWAMYADCADFGEWKFGRRTTGLVFSSAVFSQKAGGAIGGALIGWVLEALKFTANHVQTAGADRGMLVLFSLAPGVLSVATGLLVVFYPLTRKLMAEIEGDLAARKGAAAAI
ncbi:MAG TPA: glycoside-pentoside-hexuronide (GPH):cation symporter [Opitutaceae bacterium]|jgi:GPH family glycoside/pentoside/hexuronide:cation symporter